MAVALKKIEAELMKLSPRTRARLIKRLLSSLEGEPESDSEESWVAEATRRDEELHSGKAKGIPAETVFKKALICHSSACLAENPGALKLENPGFYARNARRMTNHRRLQATGNS